MFILQVPQTSLIHEMATKDPCRANPFFAFWDRDMQQKKYEDLIAFLKGQDEGHGSSECPLAQNSQYQL